MDPQIAASNGASITTDGIFRGASFEADAMNGSRIDYGGSIDVLGHALLRSSNGSGIRVGGPIAAGRLDAKARNGSRIDVQGPSRAAEGISLEETNGSSVDFGQVDTSGALDLRARNGSRLKLGTRGAQPSQRIEAAASNGSTVTVDGDLVSANDIILNARNGSLLDINGDIRAGKNLLIKAANGSTVNIRGVLDAVGEITIDKATGATINYLPPRSSKQQRRSANSLATRPRNRSRRLPPERVSSVRPRGTACRAAPGRSPRP